MLWHTSRPVFVLSLLEWQDRSFSLALCLGCYDLDQEILILYIYLQLFVLSWQLQRHCNAHHDIIAIIIIIDYSIAYWTTHLTRVEVKQHLAGSIKELQC